jgi:hypothetical protein
LFNEQIGKKRLREDRRADQKKQIWKKGEGL